MSNAFVDWTNGVVGGFLEYQKIKNPPPASPQPDSAATTATTPSKPDTVYSGSDAVAINTANAGHTTSIGGVTFDTRFLWVAGIAGAGALFLKAMK